MNILVIGGTQAPAVDSDRTYYQKYVDFFQASVKTENLQAQTYATLLEDLIVSVGDGTLSIYDTYNQRSLESYDAFFFRGAGFRPNMDIIATVQQFATEHSIPTINEYKDIRDSSKLYQATRFHTLGAPVARTIAMTPGALRHLETIEDWSFPCILKARLGSHGNDNYLVKDFDEIRRIVGEYPTKQFVMQRFVPNEGDFRILIVGDETLVIKREAVDGSHLNNTSKGGAATETDSADIPTAVLERARSLATAFGMSIAGVDALQDKQTGEFYFLEINSQPQMMSGALLEKKTQLLGKLLKGLN